MYRDYGSETIDRQRTRGSLLDCVVMAVTFIPHRKVTPSPERIGPAFWRSWRRKGILAKIDLFIERLRTEGAGLDSSNGHKDIPLRGYRYRRSDRRL